VGIVVITFKQKLKRMEQNNTKKYLDKKSLIILILSVLLVGIGVILLYDYKVTQIKEKYAPEPIIQHDTIIRDSIQIQEKVKWKYRTKYDTTLLVFRDTVHDTVMIEIPIDHYQYRDTGSTDSTRYTLGINYSGFQPTLDSVWFNYSYTPQTIVKTKRNGWGQYVGVGVQVGVGPNINVRDGTFVTGPYVGVGVTYGFGYHW
jgi:hypothetical protein